MILVWSRGVRLFHWALVIGLAHQFLNEEGEDWHEWVGYTLAGLILLRWVYGVKTKNPAESWRHFRVSPRQFYLSLKKALFHQDRPVLFHPPQSAFVLGLLMLVLLLTALTGHMQEIYYFFGEDWVQELHEYLAYGVLALAGLHVLGVFHASWVWKENLPMSMIHGRRKKPDFDG